MEEHERKLRNSKERELGGSAERVEVDRSASRETGEGQRERGDGAREGEPQELLDSRLDVSSDQFDPMLALYSTDVPLPFPNIRCFNNVAEYESFLKGGRGRAKPENVEKKQRKAQKGVPDPERIARLKELMVKNPVCEDAEEGTSGPRRPMRRQKAPKNVLTRMPLLAGSPLGSLNQCVQEHLRVKVHVRSFKGLRGVCAGFVVAFDKFWNLAMVDVDETYREPLLGEAFYHEKALTVTRLFEKLKLQEEKIGHAPHTHPVPAADGHAPPEAQAKEGGAKYGRVRTRHVNQLFIRGENVLLINIPKT
ncbi:U7 snRNA-associated Sm-like protein LSm11 [Alosa sapidissima]|uniref:U7 snRNA-associated Sm-like protein LSm11 n=1 Tax=Alosa sapidissima TaxID=34773 RepID=UPI001C08C710|nr:U7 snRNA-associated Sm-like protein LSm11 [Alosa sapidissima]